MRWRSRSHRKSEQPELAPGHLTLGGLGLRAPTIAGVTTRLRLRPQSRTSPMHAAGDISYVYGPAGQVLEQIHADGTARATARTNSVLLKLVTDGSGRPIDSFDYSHTAPSSRSRLGIPGDAGVASPALISSLALAATRTRVYYQLTARYYDPSTRQFITKDPLGALTGDLCRRATTVRLTFQRPGSPVCAEQLAGDVPGLRLRRRQRGVLGSGMQRWLGGTFCVVNSATGTAERVCVQLRPSRLLGQHGRSRRPRPSLVRARCSAVSPTGGHVLPLMP